MVYSASRGDSQSILHGAVSLTSTDGGKVPHVVEEFADDRTGPGVQPMTVDAQVELDPAGLQLELQWGVQGSEVQLLFVYLVSSERAEGFHYVFSLEEQKCQVLLKHLVWTLHPPVFHSFNKDIELLICTRLYVVLAYHEGKTAAWPFRALRELRI